MGLDLCTTHRNAWVWGLLIGRLALKSYYHQDSRCLRCSEGVKSQMLQLMMFADSRCRIYHDIGALHIGGVLYLPKAISNKFVEES
jgi:hypothetical protein